MWITFTIWSSLVVFLIFDCAKLSSTRNASWVNMDVRARPEPQLSRDFSILHLFFSCAEEEHCVAENINGIVEYSE